MTTTRLAPHSERERTLTGSQPTFDEELLSWLGGEPEAERAADADRIREISAAFEGQPRAVAG